MIFSKVDNLIVVKVFKDNFRNIDIYDMDGIFELFKVIFSKIKKKYKIRGLCYVDAYLNDDFGMIIEIRNVYKEIEEIDVKISFHIDQIFLNEVWDDEMDFCDEVYFYEDKYYTCYNKRLDSSIIYKNSLDVIKYGIKLK